LSYYKYLRQTIHNAQKFVWLMVLKVCSPKAWHWLLVWWLLAASSKKAKGKREMNTFG
jgi:hypothetical protein